jgi:glycosyltransferase involved in cell wall biosynthesis
LQPELWIVGDGTARAELEAMAKRTYPRTIFYGARYGSELDDLYNRAELFVLPGTGGLAVQQAMSFSLPVLVAEADGTQSNLVRRDNGWVIPPASLEALTMALENALSDPGRLRQMGQVSHQIIMQEVNLERMVEVFAQAIHAVTGRK